MKVRSRLNVVLLICIIVLLVSLPLTAYSIYEDPYNNLLENDKQVVSDFVELWIKDMYHNDGTKVDKISQVLDENENVTGYIIDFSKNNEDNGYIVLDRSQPDVVKDFSLTSKSIYDNLTDNANKKIYTKSKLFFDGTDFYLKIKSGKEWGLMDLANNITNLTSWKNDTSNTQKAASDLSVNNFILNKSSIPNGSEKTISRAENYIPVTMNEFDSNNHCGPTTVLNLIKLAEHRGQGAMCNKNNNSQLFGMICGAMNFNPDKGATNSQIYKALKSVVKHLNTKVVIDEYWFDLWSDFKRDIDAGKSIYFGINTKKDGHAMIAVGYRTCSNANYLRVIDNWNRHTERYVLFDKSPYTDFDGASVVFKSL